MKLLPVFYIFCLLFIPGVYMQFEYDDEDPRVSRSQPQGSDNYHSIPASTPTKIFDNNDPLKFQNDQGPLMFQPTSKPNLIQQQSKSYPNNLRVQKHQKKIQASEGERDELNSSRQSCQWMTLDEFKNVSLDTVEVIIKDKQENACYILTIRAYLKKDEFTYFPVNKYKTYHYDKNFYTIPSDGANNRFPTNCSLTSISGDGATGPLRTVIPFQEEITISVECGYLILKFVSQGYYLKLETLSFYQNSGNSETHSPNQRSNYQDRGFYRSKPKMSNEHLVFSPKNTSQNPPLLITPLVSRFVCQNRVVLNGFNEVQFVTDKFELLRLLYTPSLMPLPSLDNYKNRKVNNEFWYPHRRSEIRNTRDTRLTSSGPVVVTRCPNPITPLTALESFMTVKVNEPLMGASSPIGSTAYRTYPFVIGGDLLGLCWLNYILIQYFIWLFFDKFVMVYNGLSLKG